MRVVRDDRPGLVWRELTRHGGSLRSDVVE